MPKTNIFENDLDPAKRSKTKFKQDEVCTFCNNEMEHVTQVNEKIVSILKVNNIRYDPIDGTFDYICVNCYYRIFKMKEFSVICNQNIQKNRINYFHRKGDIPGIQQLFNIKTDKVYNKNEAGPSSAKKEPESFQNKISIEGNDDNQKELNENGKASSEASDDSHLEVMRYSEEKLKDTESGGGANNYEKNQFRCESHDKNYRNLNQYNKHMRRFHSKSRSRRSTRIYGKNCSECGEKFDSLVNYRKHKRTHLAVLQCESCNSVNFDDLSLFELHQSECRGKKRAVENDSRRATRSMTRSIRMVSIDQDLDGSEIGEDNGLQLPRRERNIPSNTQISIALSSQGEIEGENSESLSSFSRNAQTNNSSTYKQDDNELTEQRSEHTNNNSTLNHEDTESETTTVHRAILGEWVKTADEKVATVKSARVRKSVHSYCTNFTSPETGASTPSGAKKKRENLHNIQNCETESPKERYTCAEIGCNYENFLIELRVHDLLKHNKRGQAARYICKKCNKRFERRMYLKAHLKYQNIGDYICSQCETSFRLEYDLHEHLEQHKEQINYSCLDCGARFLTEKDYDNHINTKRHCRRVIQRNMFKNRWDYVKDQPSQQQVKQTDYRIHDYSMKMLQAPRLTSVIMFKPTVFTGALVIPSVRGIPNCCLDSSSMARPKPRPKIPPETPPETPPVLQIVTVPAN